MRFVVIMLVVVSHIGLAGSVMAKISAEGCKQQFMDKSREDIACQLHYQPGPHSLSAVLDNTPDSPEKQVLQSVIASAQCSTTLKARKSDIRQHWFTARAVHIPELPVQCVMTNKAGAQLTLTTLARMRCDRPGQAWQCQLTIRETTGLSFVGKALESMINNNQNISHHLTQMATSLAKVFHKNP